MLINTYPPELPGPQIESFTEKPQRNVASFQPDVGPPIYRRRSTAICYETTGNFIYNVDQLARFNEWFSEDLKDGSLAFEMDHPRTGVTYRWCFTESPEETAQTHTHTQVNFNLLRLP
jgi:hypothetical protein